jgi:sugar phosphate isomerase/epimerase
MQVGVDAFALHPLKLTPLAMLEWASARQFAGVQFGYLGDDPGLWREVRAEADRRGLYSHVSVASPNPYLGKQDAAALRATLTAQIERAAASGWHELHSSLGGPETRYRHAVPWPTHLADATALLRQLGPVLRACRSRINLETHGEVTSFELVRLIEAVGADIAGVCLDTANTLCFAENPVAAARRVAPYTHLTHAKDGLVYFCATGIMRQGRPPGQGQVDWPQLLPILAAHQPDLPLSIEDHKWLFSADIFLPAWHQANPDLSREELAQVVQLAWQTTQRIAAGELPDPERYEAIPYAEELEARLTSGRAYLAAQAAALPRG